MKPIYDRLHPLLYRLPSKRVVWLAMLVLVIGKARGQAGCFRFETDSVGCAPLTVAVTNCSTPGQPVAYNFDYGLCSAAACFETVSLSNNGDTNQTYPTPGLYEIRQVISGGDPRVASRRHVQVFDVNSKPVFALTSCPNLIKLYIKDTIFRQCRVEWSGQTLTVQVPQGGANVELPNTVAAEQDIQIMVTGINPANCGNTTLTKTVKVYPALPTPQITLAQGTSVNGVDGVRITFSVQEDIRFQLKWRALAGSATSILLDSVADSYTGQVTRSFGFPALRKYELILTQGIGCDAAATDSLTAINPSSTQTGVVTFPALDPDGGQLYISLDPSPLSPTQTQFIDSVPYRCNETRCYSLKVQQGVQTYQSSPLCLVSGQGQSGSLQMLSSRWDASAGKHILRFDSTSAVLTFAAEGAEAVSYFPPALAINQPGCIEVGYQDSCGNSHAADSLYCPFLLTGSLERDLRTLTFSPPSGPGLPASFTYFIHIRDGAGNEIGRFSASQSPYKDKGRYASQRLVYQMQAVSVSCPRDTSLSNPVEIVRQAALIMADAFSPNGDAHNDTLMAEPHFIEDATISIFDAWGEAMYKSGLPFAWSGQTSRGKAPAGNYLALIHAKTQQGDTFVERRWITLIE